jgi:predicted PolB exonuclease-like 3'-5' exonuclease
MNYVPAKTAEMLATEVCKDLHPDEVYQIAQTALTEKFIRYYSIEDLKEEYEERYTYVFTTT